jgi:hypothetical protein
MKPASLIFASLITLSSLSLADPAKSAALFSDDFGTGQGYITRPVGSATVYTDTGVGPFVPDGARDVRLDLQSSGSNAPTAGISGGEYTLNNPAQNATQSFNNIYRIRWDGSSNTLGNTLDTLNTTSFPLNNTPGTFSSALNLNSEPIFRVTVTNYNFVPTFGSPAGPPPDSFVQFYTTFYNATQNASLTIASNTISNNLQAAFLNVDFDFSSWGSTNLGAVSAIDLTTVTRTSITGNRANSTDLSINIIQTAVPFEFSPAMGFGLLGAAWGANRFRNSFKLKTLVKATI